jgi:hypothetical protein
VAIAAIVYCPEAYISRATWALWAVITEGRPPRRPRARAAASPAGGAFADEVAFEFGQGGEHVEDELAAGGGGVDRLLKAAEPDPALGQARDGVDQMAQGTAQPVQFPNDQGVARAELVQKLLEGRAVSPGAAGGLSEYPVAAGGGEGVDLEVWLLVGGGDADIAEQVSHGVTVSQPSDSGGCATLISDTGSGHRWRPWRRGSGGCHRNVRFSTPGFWLARCAVTRERLLLELDQGEQAGRG